MIKNIILIVLVISIVENESRQYGTRRNLELVSSRDIINRKELVRIVRVLNGEIDAEIDQNAIAPRYHINPSKLVKGLEKKYPNRLSNRGTGIRYNYIKNPHVLEEFVKNLRKKKESKDRRRLELPSLMMAEDGSTSSSSDIDDGVSESDVEIDVRRNAMFRVRDKFKENQNDADDKNENADHNLNFPPSIEAQVTPFKPHFIGSKEKKDSNGEDKSIEGNAPTKKFKAKSTDSLTEENDKDILDTNPFQIEKDVKVVNDIVSKEKENKYARPSNRQIKDVEEDDTNNRPRKLRRKKTVRERKQKEMGKSREEWPKKKTISKSGNLDKGYDEPKLKKEKDWGALKGIEDSINNDWDKMGRQWAKGKGDKEERPVKSLKRKQKIYQEEVYSKPSHVARIPAYHRPPARQGSFQGRTPIPFVGKRGIYEDK